MKFITAFVAALTAALASAQTLNIPTRVGAVQRARASVISANRDFGNAEFDSGIACNEDEGGDPVFIIRPGVTISNLIIGPNQIDGIHCEGACTIRNVWFRNVCEDAVTALGAGNVLIEGGGATGASDKVIQANGRGTVTIRNYTVTNSGKLYRSCGNCSNNQARSPRRVIVDNVRASGMTSEFVAINANFGDTAEISRVCGSNNGDICRPYQGIERGQSGGGGQSGNAGCGGAQGTLATTPAC
ncbi:putative pectate lyase E [Boeremia exigua]|uniref:putative pectate lyase E n=1 Tax=Boeremia exigua TaxID=749465 RepID=UPI001E8EEFD5|nr:putative pectate lyase E [Boeremia exigua]KAH6619075.1 putative pectate lyase E [Boeremia exigua]